MRRLKSALILYSLSLGLAFTILIWISSLQAYAHGGFVIWAFDLFGENFFESFVMFPTMIVINLVAIRIFLNENKKDDKTLHENENVNQL